jgi:hypothetical protein
MIQFIRIFTGSVQQSHIENLDIDFGITRELCI